MPKQYAINKWPVIQQILQYSQCKSSWKKRAHCIEITLLENGQIKLKCLCL